MQASLNDKGLLSLERKGKLEKQLCPFSPRSMACGTWCPKFHVIKSPSGIGLDICGTRFPVEIPGVRVVDPIDGAGGEQPEKKEG